MILNITTNYQQLTIEEFEKPSENSQTPHKSALNTDAKNSYSKPSVDVNLLENNGFVILKYKTDFVGCGKVKEGKILNFLSKIRRVKDVY